MLVVLTRGLLLYLLVFIAMRIMGKRQVGQLQPFELVVAIMLADLAAVPMQDKSIPLVDGLIPIIVLLMAEVTLSYFSLRSLKIRELICGMPAVLIENGRLVEGEMRRNRYNLSDLLEQLRNKGYFNMSDIEYAILETNGQLSVIPKSQRRPVCCADLEVPTEYEGLPATLITDGDINETALEAIGHDKAWLRDEIRKRGISSTEDVFFASLDTTGRFYCQAKERGRS